ncbi:RsmD family RNA methyltransferase [Caulobacter segnis]
MSDAVSGKTDAGGAHLHRLVLFSDAVFAIAITLLAIEIHPPHHWTTIGDLFVQMSAKLLAYAVSFGVIGICWFSHRRVFARLLRADDGLDFVNFLVLGLIALLPLATELVWEAKNSDALFVYVSQVALIGVAMGLVWAYAALRELTEPMSAGESWFVWLRVTSLPGVMCGLSLFSLVYPWRLGRDGLAGLGSRTGSVAACVRAPAAAKAASMRIVSGQYRGKAIVAPPGDATRPTSDRARRAVSSTSWSTPPGRSELHGARVIDVFAGSGALGLEALSRGAGFCLFVETDDAARGAIRENIDAMHLFGVTRVHRRDATDLGPRPASAGAPFDIAFPDPPYAKGLGEKAVAQLKIHDWPGPPARS